MSLLTYEDFKQSVLESTITLNEATTVDFKKLKSDLKTISNSLNSFLSSTKLDTFPTREWENISTADKMGLLSFLQDLETAGKLAKSKHDEFLKLEK